ncbi:hypothetical protein [Pantoea piersonii]|uniref:hypothetical protein n=1 Tax=Pantoea piersonii TaxID=2364647 RepID=UPI002897136E|nr:hypothetical protein [Pantoea piersonii]
MTTFKLPSEARKEIRDIYHSERDSYVHQYIQRHLRGREELIEMHPIALLRLQEKILDGYRIADMQVQEMFIPGNPMMRVVLDRPQSVINADREELEAQAEADLVDQITDEITQVYAARHRAEMEAKAAEEAAALEAEAPTMRDRIRAALTGSEVG